MGQEYQKPLKLKKEHEGAMYINRLLEKLSLIASVMNDLDRAAGRGGVGAVMGSKA